MIVTNRAITQTHDQERKNIAEPPSYPFFFVLFFSLTPPNKLLPSYYSKEDLKGKQAQKYSRKNV